MKVKNDIFLTIEKYNGKSQYFPATKNELNEIEK